jgi:hypothetical protein
MKVKFFATYATKVYNSVEKYGGLGLILSVQAGVALVAQTAQ